jgi:hypothetical protein
MDKLKEKHIVDLIKFNHDGTVFKRIYESKKKDDEDIEDKIFEISTIGDIIKMIHYLLDVLSAELIFDKLETFQDIYDKSKS